MSAPILCFHSILGNTQLTCITCSVSVFVTRKHCKHPEGRYRLSSSLSCSQDLTQCQHMTDAPGIRMVGRAVQWAQIFTVGPRTEQCHLFTEHTFVMFLWPASRICRDWTLSKWGKARPRTCIEYPGMHETGLENENVTPLLFEKKNSKMHDDCFRNLGTTQLGGSVG